jgi:hypothetical protein
VRLVPPQLGPQAAHLAWTGGGGERNRQTEGKSSDKTTGTGHIQLTG